MFSSQLLSFSFEIRFKLTRLYYYLSIWKMLTQWEGELLKTQNEIMQKTTGYLRTQALYTRPINSHKAPYNYPPKLAQDRKNNTFLYD